MFSIILLASSMLNLSAPGSESPQNSVPNWLINLVVQGKPSTLKETQERLESLFNQSTDGGGVASYEMFHWREAATRAQRRSMYLSSLLQKDIDGDGAITKQDLDVYYTPATKQKLQTNVGISVTPTKEQQAEILKKVEEQDFKLDTNGDQRITFDEMLQGANRKMEGEKFSASASPIHPDKMMSLDRNLDGVVTKDEYFEEIAEAYKQVDGNGDGVISQEEIRIALTNIMTPK